MDFQWVQVVSVPFVKMTMLKTTYAKHITIGTQLGEYVVHLFRHNIHKMA